jgi:4,5-dihydroxyphthalate decarboxylase
VKVRLTLACGDYDRTRALRDGEVQPEGIDLTYISLPVEETFFRMLRYREFEAAEMSLSSYTTSLFDDDPSMIAIPVFSSRAFRHSGVFINGSSGIRKPEDLRGKVVGNPEYELTACVWMRGILAEHHGVPTNSVRYLTGGLEQLHRREKLDLELPERFDVAPIGGGKTLSEALVRGEIDALYTPRGPVRLRQRCPTSSAAVAGLAGGGGDLLRGDPDLSDHACGGAAARCVRACSVGGPVPHEGFHRGTGSCV